MSTADGSVGTTTKIVDSGPDNRRFNLVIMGDGYRSTELPQFATDAQNFVNLLLATPPYDAMRNAINVHRVDVTSTDSGADDPNATPAVTANTYFDGTFGAAGLARLLVANNATALSVANTAVPVNHGRVLLVNSATYGGSGGSVAVVSTHPDSARIGIHELGHSAFGLADEYEYWVGCGSDTNRDNHPATEPGEPNVTTNNDAATIKWRAQVSASPMPTMSNPDCTQCDSRASTAAAGAVGAFEGAHYYHCGAYRPTHDCMMRTLGVPLCVVCSQRIRTVLGPHLPGPHEVHREAWNTGWTSIVTLDLGGVPHILTYNAGTGEATINSARLDGSGTDNALAETWAAGFTTIMPFAMGGAGWFIAYNAATGQAQITSVAADGSSVNAVSSTTWSTGFTTLMPFTLASGPGVLAYAADGGRVRMATVRADGSGVDVHYSPLAGWSSGWTSFVSFNLGGQPHALAYKTAEGRVSIDRIRADASSYDNVWGATWSTGWELFPSFEMDGLPHYLGYKPGLGNGAMDRVRPDGRGVDVPYLSMWRTGWTAMTPFRGTSSVFSLAYKSGDGTMAIDAVA